MNHNALIVGAGKKGATEMEKDKTCEAKVKPFSSSLFLSSEIMQ